MTDDDDFETWLMEWQRERQLEAWRRQYHDSEKCPSCKHPAHGVRCSFTGTYVHCECPSSLAWGETA